MTIRPELLDELLSGCERPDDLLGDDGLFKELKKALLERALGAELSAHLGYEKGDPGGRGSGNSRNGYSEKTVLTEDGSIDLSVPRDRNGTFEPVIVPKGERRLDGFDERIISLYARGVTVREIQGHLQELYGVEVSPDLISRVTDAVLDEVREWQSRPLDAVYPQTLVQTCIVHLIRNSLAFVSWKDRKTILPAIKAIYRAENAEAAAQRLSEFEARWGPRYPAIGPTWRRAWDHVVPMFAFAPAIRKIIYTTNAVESLHRSLRKIIKTRGSFPSDEAATKLLFLAIRNAGIRWKRPIEWTAAMGQFAILFEDRFPASAR
jgi:transposase-like protein